MMLRIMKFVFTGFLVRNPDATIGVQVFQLNVLNEVSKM